LLRGKLAGGGGRLSLDVGRGDDVVLLNTSALSTGPSQRNISVQ
jgi:hypothetical protein